MAEVKTVIRKCGRGCGDVEVEEGATRCPSCGFEQLGPVIGRHNREAPPPDVPKPQVEEDQAAEEAQAEAAEQEAEAEAQADQEAADQAQDEAEAEEEADPAGDEQQ